ncbi:MAG: YggT family protein [Gammaproteobacteria bacterium]|nr:YggT family protein [Gammaproteobacteria bacterium]
MTPNTFANASIFLISTLFDLITFLFIARVVLVAIRADYYNPISQFVNKLTQSIVSPLRRFIPNYKNIELASVVIILVLAMLKFCLLGLILFGHANPIGLFVLASADFLKSILNLFFYAILLQAIMSWIQSGYSPVANLLNQITTPLMRPFQRIIPPIGGMDITPIPVMILLQLLLIVIVAPLFTVGQGLAFG